MDGLQNIIDGSQAFNDVLQAIVDGLQAICDQSAGGGLRVIAHASQTASIMP